MYMRNERKATEGILDAITGNVREHGLQGPGAMAAEEAESTPPPFLMQRGGGGARLVVIVCVLATLWLGVGASVGALPGVQRLLVWTEIAVQTLR
jgi:hypothetical protein